MNDGPRPFHELWRDDCGQLLAESALLIASVSIPLGMTAPWAIDMIEIYFYRIAGAMSLPFP